MFKFWFKDRHHVGCVCLKCAEKVGLAPHQKITSFCEQWQRDNEKRDKVYNLNSFHEAVNQIRQEQQQKGDDMEYDTMDREQLIEACDRMDKTINLDSATIRGLKEEVIQIKESITYLEDGRVTTQKVYDCAGCKELKSIIANTPVGAVTLETIPPTIFHTHRANEMWQALESFSTSAMELCLEADNWELENRDKVPQIKKVVKTGIREMTEEEKNASFMRRRIKDLENAINDLLEIANWKGINGSIIQEHDKTKIVQNEIKRIINRIAI
jgi:hypothetical protein